MKVEMTKSGVRFQHQRADKKQRKMSHDYLELFPELVIFSGMIKTFDKNIRKYDTFSVIIFKEI